MRAPRPLYLPTLVALGITVAACGTDPVKGFIPKFPFDIPKLDAGIDGSTDEVTCSGGKEVGSNEQRTRYEAASVPAGETCAEETQSRTCEEDGTWSDWSGNFKIVLCEVETDVPCTDGATESREAWDGVLNETDAGFEGECLKETQTRTCADGAWGSWSGTYKFPECPLTFEGCDDKPHLGEETRERWASVTVNPGQTCTPETQKRTCMYGEWSDWTGTYTEMNCTVLEFANCGDKPHLATETRTMYEAVEATATAPCVSEEQTRTCNNGEWSDWEGEDDVPFTKEFCDPNGEKRCNKPGGGTIAHNAKHTYSFYPSATVPYGQTCVPFTQEATCANGTLPAYTGTATAVTCSETPGAGCVDGNVTKPHDSIKTQVRYQNARVPFGSSCVSETQTSKCTNGDWIAVGTHTYTQSECKRHCEGGDHGVTQNRTRYQDPSVPVGQLCTSIDQEQSRTCTDGAWGPGPLAGGWSGSAIYDEDTCRVRKRDCTTEDDEKLFDGESLTRVRYKAAFPTTACESQTQEQLCTDGTLGAWKPADYDLLACSKLPATKTGVSSCRWVATNTPQCIEYKEPVLFGPETYCALQGGDWDTTRGCSTEKAIASCKRGDETQYYYFEPDEDDCSGDWTVLTP